MICRLHDYKQLAYSLSMRTVFFETTSFTATVGSYLTDDEYRALQTHMQLNPQAGDVMPRTGGFRKLRWADDVEVKADEVACGLSIIGL
jgi:hypothetical protein